MTSKHRARLVAFLLGGGLVLLAILLGEGGGATARAAASDAGAAPGRSGVRPRAARRAQGAFIRRNPFQIDRVHPPPPPTPEERSRSRRPPLRPPTPTPPATPPPVELLGTIAGAGPGSAFLTGGRAGAFVMSAGDDLGEHLGDDWKGTVLSEVERKRVVFLQEGGARHVFELGDEAAGVVRTAAPAPAGGPPPPRPPVATPPAPTRGAGDEVELSRGEVNQKLKNLGFLITQLNVQPFYERGQPAGFRVSRIRPGSFVDTLGARNGDIVRSVNGQPIRNVKDAFLLYNGFKTKPEVKVEILRGGQPRTITYRIQ